MSFLHTYHCQYFLTPTPRSKSFYIQRIFWKCSKRLRLQKLDRRLGRMWIMKTYHTNFANFNTKRVFQWWWCYLWLNSSSTSLKMTSWVRTWNQHRSIYWTTTLSDILNHFHSFWDKSTGPVLLFVVLALY